MVNHSLTISFASAYCCQSLHTISPSEDNEAAKEEAPEAYCTYVEEADDPAYAGQALPTKLAEKSEVVSGHLYSNRPGNDQGNDRPRIMVMRSFRMMTENTVPKGMDVSRRAATRATGASVMAQSAMPEEAKVQAPPMRLFFREDFIFING
jgi:hypothetical protein